jgi:hypothetical protein
MYDTTTSLILLCSMGALYNILYLPPASDSEQHAPLMIDILFQSLSRDEFNAELKSKGELRRDPKEFVTSQIDVR